MVNVLIVRYSVFGKYRDIDIDIGIPPSTSIHPPPPDVHPRFAVPRPRGPVQLVRLRRDRRALLHPHDVPPGLPPGAGGEGVRGGVQVGARLSEIGSESFVCFK